MRSEALKRFCILVAGLAAAATAAAAGPLEVATAVLVEKGVAAADGTTHTRLVAPERVVPGDRIVVELRYRNTGPQPLGGVVIANPVPAGLAFRAVEAGTPEPEVSVDGTTFARLSALTVRTAQGASRPAAPGDVRAVRWRIGAPVAPGVAGRLAFRAVVK